MAVITADGFVIEFFFSSSSANMQNSLLIFGFVCKQKMLFIKSGK